jgi:hypothetical protein
MNPIESPIAENYHDIVFSQQRHQPAQDCIGIPHSWDRRRSKATYRAITFIERDVYHLPIYSRGPSWMSPWQALVAGVLCLGLGLFSIIRAVPTKKEK